MEIYRGIAPDDAMFSGDEEHYFAVSSSAISCIDAALALAGKTEVRSVLDMPCGHGRVLRSLVARFPEADVTACDLDRKAVDFCRSTFDVEGAYSNPEFTADIVSRTFDLIWCGSLLTHLCATDAKRLLAFMFEKLAADGLLLITSHGRFSWAVQQNKRRYVSDDKFQQVWRGFEGEGHGYVDYEQSKGYGLSMSTPSWLLAQVEERKDVTIVCFSERRWDGHQDVLAVQKRSVHLLRDRDRV